MSRWLTPPRSRRARVLCLGGALLASGCGSVAPATTQPKTATPTAGAGSVHTQPSPKTPNPTAPTPTSLRPRIRQDPIPFPPSRRREMVAYARRHYGLDTYRLIDPRVIVEHYTETPGIQATYNTFAPDHPDSELHELPNTCAHFVVDRDGRIYQLVSLNIMCRHTVGLNYTAIGIENVGYSDGEILRNPVQMRSLLALTRWLRCRYRIAVKNVIGHNESLSSPYHHENVPSLRTQTHSDWRRADMNIYRARLRALGCG